MKLPVRDAWLFGSAMAVLWTLVIVICWVLLLLAFGRSSWQLRALIELILGALVVAVLSSHGYREGWKRGCVDEALVRKSQQSTH